MLELRREKLSIGNSGGQLLVIYHAEPGSETARSLALLGSLAATGPEPERPRHRLLLVLEGRARQIEVHLVLAGLPLLSW
jgi:hypothetical protein